MNLSPVERVCTCPPPARTPSPNNTHEPECNRRYMELFYASVRQVREEWARLHSNPSDPVTPFKSDA